MSAHTAPEPEPGYSVQALLAASAAANAVCTPPGEHEEPEPDATQDEPTTRPQADAA
ncbi:hypothetical protein OG539_25420 [Actinacidiphila glaucinigra]|uniref:hypothetical protein n=1 Tax=Actinacidiphila glaucinigra TaxID=235986 RepID=UPI002DDC0D09|nr:hypothetical protein [Actinacidiphila glaucinigra]WSD60588.1 hypothetical protein OIE69_17485 [Actinacidiphila glaucinigra]